MNQATSSPPTPPLTDPCTGQARAFVEGSLRSSSWRSAGLATLEAFG
jgi:hypothetical protein